MTSETNLSSQLWHDMSYGQFTWQMKTFLFVINWPRHNVTVRWKYSHLLTYLLTQDWVVDLLFNQWAPHTEHFGLPWTMPTNSLLLIYITKHMLLSLLIMIVLLPKCFLHWLHHAESHEPSRFGIGWKNNRPWLYKWYCTCCRRRSHMSRNDY